MALLCLFPSFAGELQRANDTNKVDANTTNNNNNLNNGKRKKNAHSPRSRPGKWNLSGPAVCSAKNIRHKGRKQKGA